MPNAMAVQVTIYLNEADQWHHRPLHIEILYNEYNFVGAFAVASLLSMLAVVTLIIKTLVERSGYRRR